ncbi:hypothetical protein C0J52_05119, partial [Blattella germanica]
IETAEVKFLRSVSDVTLIDKKRNTDVRNNLNIFNLTDRINQLQDNWHNHIQRMDSSRLPHILLNCYKPRGSRSIGPTRW